jgi:hypothetical protein
MRFVDALLPVLTVALEQCRKLASEPEPAPVAVAAVEAKPAAPARKPHARRAEPEPQTLLPLGEPVTRIRVKSLRPEERQALLLLRTHGPLTFNKFRTLTHGMKPAERNRVLEDLDRYGLTAAYRTDGRAVIHVTADAQAVLDVDPWTE